MPRPRLELDEYGSFRTVAALAADVGAPEAAFARELDRLERRIATRLGIRSLERRGSGVRPIKVAGVARLAMADVEIRPKYALSSETWREDLLELTRIAAKGAAMPAGRISASPGGASLPDLLAESFLAELSGPLRRGVIRRYAEREWSSWAISGDFDAHALLTGVSPEGVAQRQVELSPANPDNALLAAAASHLVPQVRSPDTRRRLHELLGRLGPQAAPPRRMSRRLPLHQRPFAPALELAESILATGGVSLQSGPRQSLGIVLATEIEWQRFVSAVLARAAASLELSTTRQTPFALTHDDRVVKPDDVVRRGDDAIAVFDAKYKSDGDAAVPRVATGDLYEAMAFMEGAGTARAILVYPVDRPVGVVVRGVDVELLAQPERIVQSIGIGLNGLAGPHGIDTLAAAVVATIRPLLAAA